jgi:hypothetical protein
LDSFIVLFNEDDEDDDNVDKFRITLGKFATSREIDRLRNITEVTKMKVVPETTILNTTIRPDHFKNTVHHCDTKKGIINKV